MCVFFQDISFFVFAYLHGDAIAQTTMYFSDNQGYRFQKYFHEGQAQFLYSDYPLNHSLGLPFNYSGLLDIISAPGQKGVLIFWFKKNLLISKNAELLQGDFENKIYNIDMNSKLELAALMIPRPSTSPVPLVIVSNPHSLGLQAVIYENSHTYDGNIEYKLNISLRQQQHYGRADPSFTSSIERPTMSTVTVDIANKEISCVDLKPLTALISIGCDLEKKIVIRNEISACNKGILDPVTLQNNYSYVIEKEAYSFDFQTEGSTEDLVVPYPYEKLGCPLLVYYNTPWKPVVELWRDGSFEEVIQAEYVLLEVNGLFTYTYSLTARTALCSSQPQNWTSIIKERGDIGPLNWDRENYVSCRDPNNHVPLKWPDVPYQILGGPTDNKVTFDQRNGFYIFLISIVDPYYSYCHLETIFSVYVYGAFPLPMIPPEITIILLMLAILLSVWLAYMIPKVLRTEWGHRVQGLWASLGRTCVSHAGAAHALKRPRIVSK
ncbi:Transmembrane protein 146 [Pteropus alecto]|uniref:Cation channel sperm-associated auxiliary subunit delta n=1 Tax=Pteropus alecto TaxID=9402 RepID=L5L7Q4_PTEAL|nr:Transmembrane protein 146 [Pteropus alecto]